MTLFEMLFWNFSRKHDGACILTLFGTIWNFREKNKNEL